MGKAVLFEGLQSGVVARANLLELAARLDFDTGEQVWDGGQFGDQGSCILTADDRLILWGQRGKLVLAETDARSPGKYKELAVQYRIFNTEAWPHVVLSDGRLICKDRMGNIKCFGLGVERGVGR